MRRLAGIDSTTLLASDARRTSGITAADSP